jgi:hypothetical protein
VACISRAHLQTASGQAWTLVWPCVRQMDTAGSHWTWRLPASSPKGRAQSVPLAVVLERWKEEKKRKESRVWGLTLSSGQLATC